MSKKKKEKLKLKLAKLQLKEKKLQLKKEKLELKKEKLGIKEVKTLFQKDKVEVEVEDKEKTKEQKLDEFKKEKADKKEIKDIIKKEREQENLNKVFQTAQKYAPNLTKQVQEQLEKGVVGADLLEDFKKFVSGSAEKISSKTPELVNLYNSLADIKEELYSKEELWKIADDLENIFKGPMGGVLSEDLPKFLKLHDKEISDSVGKFYEKNPEFAEQALAMSFDEKSALELTQAATILSYELIPLFIDFAKELFTHKKALVEVFEQINIIAKAEGDLSKSAAVTSLASSLYILLSENPKFTTALMEKMPEILERHGAELGPALDQLMSKTQWGRNLTIKGAKILETVGDKTPQIMSLLTAIEKGSAIKIIISGIRVFADPEMLKLTATLIGDLARYSYQKNIVTNATRRKQCGSDMNQILDQAIKDTKEPKLGEKLPDLGSLLEKQVNPEQKNALQYSIKNHDFRGLHLEQDPLKLQKFKIDNFRFNDTEFKGHVSFEGSKLENCSFKNVVFKKGVSFKGATIDAKALETLIPAINKHNRKHPENKITLDGVKIVGDISKLKLRNVSLKGADLTEAQTVSHGWLSENKTNIKNADLTGATLKQGQEFKYEQSAKLDGALSLKKEQPKNKNKGGIDEKLKDKVEKIREKKNLGKHRGSHGKVTTVISPLYKGNNKGRSKW